MDRRFVLVAMITFAILVSRANAKNPIVVARNIPQ